MNISRMIPPIVRQRLVDSCWAAVLESWSRVDRHIPDQQQEDLVRRWGEGPTGGITPALKIPAIANAFGLGWGGFAAADLVSYIRRNLPHSHIFCAYTRGLYTHSILIYRLSKRGNISYMDPDGGHDRWHPTDWFLARGPYVLMRRA